MPISATDTCGSIVPERGHRIDGRGVPRGKPAGEQSRECQNRDHGNVCDGIARVPALDEAGNHLAQRYAAGESGGGSMAINTVMEPATI